MYRRRHRHGRRGRMPKPVWLGALPPITGLDPVGTQGKTEPVYLEPDELEAFRLVDLEGLSQEEAGGGWGSQGEPCGGFCRTLGGRRLKPSVKAGRYASGHLPQQTDLEENVGEH
ncbi:MAG: hypothetical protein QXI20_07810 [Candidatus Jordarchaeales archaeon]